MSSRLSFPRVEWMWKSNKDPWNRSEKEEWTSYSDVETAIIEQGYQNKLSEVLIDDYHIDLGRSLQISNSNASNQRPVKRINRNQSTSEPRLREARFMPNPIHPASPFADQVLYLRFVGEVFTNFGVTDSNTLAQPEYRRRLIEKAAEGIIMEGKLVGKIKEAEWIAQQLLNNINNSDEEVWQCCAHLYTMESFLYKKMNEYMRLCGDHSKIDLWKSKVVTFGPFGYLLYSLTYSKSYSTFYLYRGADLSNDLIQQYRDNIGVYLTFPAFTSTSRNRKKAEQFGNVLFVIHAASTHGYDIAPFSDYPDEEETLLKSDFAFYIRECIFDQSKNKWIIHVSAWKDE